VEKATTAHTATCDELLRGHLHYDVLPVDALLCHNTLWNDQSHCNKLDVFVNDIVKSCLSASNSSLPHSARCGSRGHMPGWTEHVAPLLLLLLLLLLRRRRAMLMSNSKTRGSWSDVLSTLFKTEIDQTEFSNN
jgi:hypothetical protein